MNFQWILLALFAVSLIWQIAKAMTRPMLKNIINLICIPVAFILTYAMQVMGIFQRLSDMILNKIDLKSLLGSYQSAYQFISAFVGLMITPIFFVITFKLLFFLFRLVHSKLIYKYIVSRQERKAKRSIKRSVKAEKKAIKEAIRSSEKETRELIDALSEVVDEDRLDEIVEETLDLPSRKDIENMAEKRVKKEKRRLRRNGFFKESPEKRAISVVCGAVSGFILFAITYMPLFYSMGFLSTVTEGVKNSKADDSKVYQVVSIVDKHIVTPYEESFVIELYDNMALIDLMNYATRAGGKMVMDNGDVIYVDDVLRKLSTYSTRVAAGITSSKVDAEDVTNDINVIISDPLVVNMFADVLVKLIDGLEVPPKDSEDLMGNLVPNIIKHYKELDKEGLIKDMGAVSETIVVAAKTGLLADYLGGNKDIAGLLGEKEKFGDILSSMSGLSVYSPLVEGLFTPGIGMIGPMLGIPADNAAAYDAFTANIVNTAGGLNSFTAEDIAAVMEFMAKVSEVGSVYDYVTPPDDFDKDYDPSTLTPEEIERIEALIDEYEKRIDQLPIFIKYMTAWMSAQKPFMVANEDTSSACLTLTVDGVIYLSNTDEISIEDLLGVFDDGSEGEGEGEGDDGISEEYKNLLKKITVVKVTEANYSEYERRISPLHDLINYIIANAPYITDTAALNTILRAYVTVAPESASKDLANRLLSENRDAFVYSGVTVEKMQAAKNFDPEVWGEKEKEEDSRVLVDIIFTLMDMKGALEGGEGSEGEGSESKDPVEGLIGALGVLGKTMDLMADTTCLASMPEYMLDGLLKNEMLSLVITPKMLQELNDDRSNDPDFSYEEFLTELADTLTGLLDSVAGEGGTEE